MKPRGELVFDLPISKNAAEPEEDDFGEDECSLFGVEADGEAAALAVEARGDDVIVVDTMFHDSLQFS